MAERAPAPKGKGTVKSKGKGISKDKGEGGSSKPWAHSAKPRQVHESELSPGMSGIIVTCDTHIEKSAVRESFAVLSQVWDHADIRPDAQLGAAKDGAPSADSVAVELPAGSGGAVIDFAQEIANEVSQLKEDKRFFVAQTGCPGFVVLRVNTAIRTRPRMLDLVNKILASAVSEDGEFGVRFVARMLPCQTVVRAETAKIVAAVREVVSAVAADRKRAGLPLFPSFAIQFKKRYAGNIERDEVIKAAADAAQLELPAAKVNLSAPAVCIVLEVIKNCCCVCVVDHWNEYKRYSVRALQGKTLTLESAAAPTEPPIDETLINETLINETPIGVMPTDEPDAASAAREGARGTKRAWRADVTAPPEID